MAYPVELAKLFVELVAIQADGVVRLVDAQSEQVPGGGRTDIWNCLKQRSRVDTACSLACSLGGIAGRSHGRKSRFPGSPPLMEMLPVAPVGTGAYNQGFP